MKEFFGPGIGQSTVLMACWNDENGKLVKVPMILDRLEEGSIMNVGLKEEEGSEEMKALDDNDKSEVLKFLEENKEYLQEIFKVPEEYTIKYYQDE